MLEVELWQRKRRRGVEERMGEGASFVARWSTVTAQFASGGSADSRVRRCRLEVEQHQPQQQQAEKNQEQLGPSL